ncbi:MAG: hypothetical protein ACKVTZ_21460 [Bacteroidia bacterium]
MDILEQLIFSLKKEEARHFKLFAARTNDDKNRKDFLLFDAIRKNGGNFDETNFVLEHYPNAEKNAYYRLKNRLLEELSKSVWLFHFEKHDFTHELYFLSSAKLHASAKQSNLCLYYLKKAEKMALKSENFEVLDLIYSLYIQLASELPTLNPEPYLQLRVENRRRKDILDELDDLLANMMYQIRTSLNLLQNEVFLRQLSDKLKNFEANVIIAESIRLQFKLYDVNIRFLLQHRDYEQMEGYLKTVYARFTEADYFGEIYKEMELQMLTYLCNTLYFNRKYHESLAFAEVLHQKMLKVEGALYEKYEIFYLNTLVNNYHVIDKDKALLLLTEIKQNLSKKKPPFNIIFIYLYLAGLYLDKKQYRKTLRNLQELYSLEEYKSTDVSFKLCLELLHLITYFEMQEYDLCEKYVIRVQKEYHDLFLKPDFQRDKLFLELILKISKVYLRRDEKAANQEIEKWCNIYFEEQKQYPPSISQEVFDYEHHLKRAMKL